MGKSKASAALRRMGVPVHDADAAVHRMLASGGAAATEVESAFPGVTKGGAVDRQELGRRVFHDTDALARLEAILHPIVREDSRRFLRCVARRRERLAVFDIPLLFEVGRDRECDAIILVSAPPFIQAIRVLRRPGMTPARLADIRARQMPDREKRLRADFVVETGLGRRESLRSLVRIVRLLRSGRWRSRGHGI